VGSAESAVTDSDPEAAATVRLPHRPRGWVMMLILLCIGVAALPGLVDGVGYLAGAESSPTFLPLSYGQVCGRGGPASTRRRTSASPASPRSMVHQLSIHQVAPAASQEAGSGGWRCTNSPVESPSMITS